MDFSRPSAVIGPAIDGDILSVLAAADQEYTGREISRAVARSHRGVLLALDRLASQGIVHKRAAGRSNLYRLNRDHLAAPWIVGLSGLRQQLLDRMRAEIESWSIKPVVAALFGSVARGEAQAGSDIDLFLVRPSDANTEEWEEQVDALSEAVTRWTGNDARPLVLSESEIREHGADEPVIQDVLEHGVEIAGSFRALRRVMRK